MYLSDKVCINGGCDAAVTDWTRYVRFIKCGEPLCVRRVFINGVVYQSYVRIEINLI